MPKSEQLFARTPTFSAEIREQRRFFAATYRAFVTAYSVARDSFDGAEVALRDKIVFPACTYRLRAPLQDRLPGWPVT